MIWPQLQAIAQIAIGHILNSLPEGLLIALFAGAMLRLLPRQNSGTRFAVWFVALLAVAALPFVGLHLMGSVAGGPALPAVSGGAPMITLPGPWGLLLFLAWVLAASTALLRLSIGLWRLRGVRRSCVAIDPAELGPSIQKTVADCFSSRSITLATSEKVSVPAAIGFFKPMIVIPAWALRELPPGELRIILLHELTHLRRRDDWTNLLQKVVRALFFFHPAVWWIERRLSLEREMACDDAVLAETGNPRGYAKCLIGLLEKSVTRRDWAMAQAAVHRAREASLRLAQILDLTRPNTWQVRKPALGLVGAFSLISLMVVPHAPEFVAFERKAPVIQDTKARAASVTKPKDPAAVPIPSALSGRASLSSSLMPAPRQFAVHAARQVVEHHVVNQFAGERRSTAPQAVEARWSIDADHSEVDTGVQSGLELNDETIVPVEALLVVRTTQPVGQDSWVWSVYVWRITWANPTRDAAGRGPVAKRT